MSGEKSERLKTTLIASAVIVVVATVVTCSVVTWLAIRSTKGDGLVNIPPAAFIPVSSLSKRTGEEISKRTLEVGESEEEQEKLQDESQKRTFHLPGKPRNFDGKSKIFRDSYEIFMEMQKNLGFTTPGEVLAELEKKIKTEEKNNRLTRKSSAKLFVDPEDIFFLDPSSERTVQTRRNSGSSMLATSGKSNEINFGSSIWNTDELSADKRYINTTEDESDSSSQEDTYLLQLPELMKSFRPGSFDRSNRNKKTSIVSDMEQKTSGAIYQQFKKKRSRLKNNISEPFNSRSIEKNGNKIPFNTVKNSEKELNPELLHEPLEYNYFAENLERDATLSNKSLINRMDETDKVPQVAEENVSIITLDPHISLLGETGTRSPVMRGYKNLPKRVNKTLSYTEAPVSILSSVRTPSTTFGTKYQLGNLEEELDISEESDLKTPFNPFIAKYGENNNKQQTFDTFQRRKDEDGDYSQSDIATFDSIKERFPEYQSGGKNYRRVGTNQRKVEKEPSYNVDVSRNSGDSIKGTTFRKRRPSNWTSKNRKGDLYNTRRRQPIISRKTYGTNSESMEDYKQYSDNIKKYKEKNYEFSETSLDVLAALSAEEFGAKMRLKPKNTIETTPYERKEESRVSDIDDDAIMDEGPFYVPSSLKIDRIEVPTLTHEDFSEIKTVTGEEYQGSKQKRFQSTNLPIKQFLDELPRMPVSTDHIKKLYEAPDSDGWIPGRLINGGSKEVFMALRKPSSKSVVDNTSQNIFTKSNTFSFNETTNANEKNTPPIYVPEILSSSEMSQIDSPVIEIQTQDGEVHQYVTKVGNYPMQSINQTSMLLKRRRNSKLSTDLSTF